MGLFKDIWGRLPTKYFIGGAAFLLGLIVLEIWTTTLIPEWRKFFYGIMEKKQQNLFAPAVMYFLGLMGALLVAQSLKQYVGRRTALQCRTALTDLLLRKWVTSDKHSDADNPDQRINEDCRIATDLVVKVLIEVIISGAIVAILIVETLHNPYIVYAALGYTAIISVSALLFRRGLIVAEISMQKAEADHRFSLAQIALSLGDWTAVRKYDAAKVSVIHYLNKVLGFSIFSVTQNQFSILVPWVLLSVPYFAGTLTFGDFMGSTAIFELIVINATILIQLFPDVTRAHASWIRIRGFYDSL